MSSSRNLNRANNALDGYCNYHYDIHDMLNANFGFMVLENLNDEDTYSTKEKAKGELKIIY